MREVNTSTSRKLDECVGLPAPSKEKAEAQIVERGGREKGGKQRGGGASSSDTEGRHTAVVAAHPPDSPRCDHWGFPSTGRSLNAPSAPRTMAKTATRSQLCLSSVTGCVAPPDYPADGCGFVSPTNLPTCLRTAGRSNRSKNNPTDAPPRARPPAKSGCATQATTHPQACNAPSLYTPSCGWWWCRSCSAC